MAVMHGAPGEWARVKGTLSGLWPVFLCVFAAGFAASMTFSGQAVLGVLILLFALAAFGFLVVKWVRLIERYFTGARGEERVANLFSLLSDRYHIFNDVVVGKSQIDHIVVGPSGVFVVETKFWRGRVTVEDSAILVDSRPPSNSPLAQVARETEAVRGALAKTGWNGAVTPLLVFASDSFVHKCIELGGTIIMNSNEIEKSFSNNRNVMSSDEIVRLVSLMENNI